MIDLRLDVDFPTAPSVDAVTVSELHRAGAD